MVDEKYEAARNKLIPEAERHANEKAGVRPENCNDAGREAWAAKWNRAFHGKMNELAKTLSI